MREEANRQIHKQTQEQGVVLTLALFLILGAMNDNMFRWLLLPIG